jgi:DNA polymerase III gamma/tau subunit
MTDKLTLDEVLKMFGKSDREYHKAIAGMTFLIKEQQDCIKELREALENSRDGLSYAVHLVNNYEHHLDGSKVTASSTFGIIKSKYDEAKQALDKTKELK